MNRERDMLLRAHSESTDEIARLRVLLERHESAINLAREIASEHPLSALSAKDLDEISRWAREIVTAFGAATES